MCFDDSDIVLRHYNVEHWHIMFVHFSTVSLHLDIISEDGKKFIYHYTAIVNMYAHILTYSHTLASRKMAHIEMLNSIALNYL